MAEPFRAAALQSGEEADSMLIRQYRFPWEYNPGETLLRKEAIVGPGKSSRETAIIGNRVHVRSSLPAWLICTGEGEVFVLLAKITKTQPKQWNGFRVLGTRRNNYIVWVFELFAKNPSGNTVVYTGEPAPNVLREPRSIHYEST